MELLIRDKSTGDYVSMTKHLNPYRAEAFAESVMLDLEKGDTEVVLRSYNRFEDSACIGLAVADDQKVYKMKVTLPHRLNDEDVKVSIVPLDKPSPHTDCGLHNVILKLLRR